MKASRFKSSNDKLEDARGDDEDCMNFCSSPERKLSNFIAEVDDEQREISHDVSKQIEKEDLKI